MNSRPKSWPDLAKLLNLLENRHRGFRSDQGIIRRITGTLFAVLPLEQGFYEDLSRAGAKGIQTRESTAEGIPSVTFAPPNPEAGGGGTFS